MNKLAKITLLVILVALVLSGCVKPKVTLTVNTPQLDLTVGLNPTEQIGITVNPNDSNVTYESLDTFIATVDESGLVTARNKGNTKIKINATKDGYVPSEEKFVDVKVEPQPEVVLEVAQTFIELTLGTGPQENIVVTDLEPEDASVQFIPDNSGVYTVDASGLVSAVKTGTGSLIVKASKEGYISSQIPITVKVNPQPSVILSANDMTLTEGATKLLNVNIIQPIGVEVELSYESLDEEIATVDEDGVITALAPGETAIEITGSAEGYKDGTTQAVITVNEKPSVILSANDMTLTEGATKLLNVNIIQPIGVEVVLSYESLDEEIATVDEDGVITALAPGETAIEITGSAEGYKDGITGAVITVNNGKPIIGDVDVPEKVVSGREFEVKVPVFSEYSPLVSVKINGKEATPTGIDGFYYSIISLELDKFQLKDVTIYAENELGLSSTLKTPVIVVVPLEGTLELEPEIVEIGHEFDTIAELIDIDDILDYVEFEFLDEVDYLFPNPEDIYETTFTAPDVQGMCDVEFWAWDECDYQSDDPLYLTKKIDVRRPIQNIELEVEKEVVLLGTSFRATATVEDPDSVLYLLGLEFEDESYVSEGFNPYEVGFTALATGEQLVTAEAEDIFGNILETSKLVNVKEKPVIENVVLESEAALEEEMVKVTATVIDPDGDEVAEVLINGEAAERVEGTNNWELEIEAQKSKTAEEMAVVVTAKDIDGFEADPVEEAIMVYAVPQIALYVDNPVRDEEPFDVTVVATDVDSALEGMITVVYDGVEKEISTAGGVLEFTGEWGEDTVAAVAFLKEGIKGLAATASAKVIVEDGDPVISVNAEDTFTETQIRVPISFAGFVDVDAMTVKIDFNDTFMELVDYDILSPLDDMLVIVNETDDSIRFDLAGAGSGVDLTIYEDTPVIELVFLTKNVVGNTSIDVDTAVTEVRRDGVDLAYTVNDADVEITNVQRLVLESEEIATNGSIDLYGKSFGQTGLGITVNIEFDPDYIFVDSVDPLPGVLAIIDIDNEIGTMSISLASTGVPFDLDQVLASIEVTVVQEGKTEILIAKGESQVLDSTGIQLIFETVDGFLELTE